MIIFLDLEQTLIDDWGTKNTMPDNLVKIARFINYVHQTGFVDEINVGIMSWALWSDIDKEEFNKFFPLLQHAISEHLDSSVRSAVKFDDSLMMTMQDWSHRLLVHCNKNLSMTDMFDMVGKQETLFMLSRHDPTFSNETIVLIDDTVEHDMTVEVPSTNCTIIFKNVHQL